MKTFFKLIAKRLKAKTPKFFNIVAYIAAAILVLFFGADKILDLSEISFLTPSIINMIYAICTAIFAVSKMTVEKPEDLKT